jgi:hypothetical protein
VQDSVAGKLVIVEKGTGKSCWSTVQRSPRQRAHCSRRSSGIRGTKQQPTQPFKRTPHEGAQLQALGITLRGLLATTRSFLPYLSKEIQPGGTTSNITEHLRTTRISKQGALCLLEFIKLQATKPQKITETGLAGLLLLQQHIGSPGIARAQVRGGEQVQEVITRALSQQTLSKETSLLMQEVCQ